MAAGTPEENKEIGMASETEVLKKDLEDLRKSIETLTKDVGVISKSMAEQAKTDAKATLRDARSSASEFANDIGAKGRESAEAVENAVRENPFQGLLIAFGAGLVLAQFIGRR